MSPICNAYSKHFQYSQLDGYRTSLEQVFPYFQLDNSNNICIYQLLDKHLKVKLKYVFMLFKSKAENVEKQDHCSNIPTPASILILDCLKFGLIISIQNLNWKIRNSQFGIALERTNMSSLSTAYFDDICLEYLF